MSTLRRRGGTMTIAGVFYFQIASVRRRLKHLSLGALAPRGGCFFALVKALFPAARRKANSELVKAVGDEYVDYQKKTKKLMLYLW
jgi:protein-S-isoprenylcysteine O-methyltransferase Ste14